MKLRLVLDFTIASEGLSADVIRRAHPAQSKRDLQNDPEVLLLAAYQQNLLEALLSDKTLLGHYLTARMVKHIESLSAEQLLVAAGLQRDDLDILGTVVEGLTPDDRQFFHDAQEIGEFDTNTALVAESLAVSLDSIAIINGE